MPRFGPSTLVHRPSCEDEREAVHRMAVTEQQAGEPILEFFQYGSLRRVVGRGLHSSTSQLLLSRFCH